MRTNHFNFRLAMNAVLAFILSVVVGCQKENPTEQLATPSVKLEQQEVTDKLIKIQLTTEHATQAATLLFENVDDKEPAPPTVEEILSEGTFAELVESKALVEFEALPNRTYTIYAVATADKNYSSIEKIVVTTLPPKKLLSFVSSTKTSFTYKIEAEPEQTYRHCYMEGWYFDYTLAAAKEKEGNLFDLKAFLWNMLANFSYEGKGTQEITWKAGDMDEMRGNIAALAPGKKYYAIMSPYNEVETWHGNPEVVAFEMEKGGKSSADITIDVLELNAKTVKVCMTPDPNVLVFFYNIHPKATIDKYLKEKGEAWLMNYLFEYGWPAANTYTDVWDIEPNTEYTFLVYGVDKNGDEFLKTQQITSPALEPVVNVTMTPYERETEGMHTYDAISVNVRLENFANIQTDLIYWIMKTRTELDNYLAIFGLTFETLKSMPDYFMYLGPAPLPSQDAADLKNKSEYTRVFNQLESDTEYVFGILVQNEGKNILKLQTVKTDPAPGTQTAEPEYNAFIGNWKVTGQSTQDWSTPLTFNMRIAEMTTNRSFKVYGWGNAQLMQDYPFVARYDSATKKIKIDVPQTLGTISDPNLGDMNIVLTGLFMGNDGQLYTSDYNGTAFTGKIQYDHFSLYGEFFSAQGGSYEFKTLTYVLRSKKDNKDYYIDGDFYKNVNFHISK